MKPHMLHAEFVMRTFELCCQSARKPSVAWPLPTCAPRNGEANSEDLESRRQKLLSFLTGRVRTTE